MQSSSGSTSTTSEAHTRHVPVLLQQVLEVLDIQENDTVLDGTLGGGGHAAAFAERLGSQGVLVGFDVDMDAINRTEVRLHDAQCKKVFINDNFRNAGSQLHKHGIKHIDKALFDLGWSSDQLEVSGRGFSFMRDEPLQMTLSDKSDESVLTAADIVNTWQEESIADILYGWGGERRSRRIARALVAAREHSPITTTFDLVRVIESAVRKEGRLHPATKTFQALRIAVNDELGALKEILEVLPDIAYEKTRVSFLTFHSLEDKLVKETFRSWAREGLGAIITKKPLTADEIEVGQNPRSRSAKLRAFAFTHYEHSNNHSKK